MEVRQATLADVDDVVALISRFFVEEGFEGSAEVIRGRAPTFLSTPANAAFLGCVDDQAVGVATLTTAFGFESGAYAEIEDLYVAPPWRRAGLGRALVEACLRECRNRRITDIEVVVTPEGDARHDLGAWYRALGFRDTGRAILGRSVGSPMP
jgi:GNAT superfamily N-acetyltransferase